MTLAGVLFVLVIVCGLSTLGEMNRPGFVGGSNP